MEKHKATITPTQLRGQLFSVVLPQTKKMMMTKLSVMASERTLSEAFRLVDPDFSFIVESASVILQDRESETESSKNPTRRRSKRASNIIITSSTIFRRR
ncbi:hypothetical protein K1719_011172 [Acacia pycnantha]|nr:hypothetical protein K1719_011172 [Acacia pycnantha]